MYSKIKLPEISGYQLNIACAKRPRRTRRRNEA